MLYFFFISSSMINIINVNRTIFTFCIFTEMNCLFNNFYWNKPSKIFPGHITSSCLLLFYWSWIRDSNPWPRDYKSRALPTELIQQMSLSFQGVNHTFTLTILDYSSRKMTLPFWYTEVITNPHLPAAVHILTCYWWPPHRNSNCHSTFFIFRVLCWCLSLDSNQLSMTYEAIAYPHKLHRQIMGIDYPVQLPKTFAWRKL